MKKGVTKALFALCVALAVCTGCLGKSDKEHKKEKAKEEAEEDLEEYHQDSEALQFPSDGWNYDKKHKAYWQIQVSYCTGPQAKELETLAVYVPAAYMDAEKNENGTYTCTVNTEKTVNGYTAETAPVVFPVDTEEYEPQVSPASYNYKQASAYLKQGFIYVCAGMRGKAGGQNEDGSSYSGGAPWGVADLKAAVRYYRYNKDVLPGDTEQIYCFGSGAGASQAAIMGASGNSDLYTAYLTEIGAAVEDKEGNELGDEIAGVMAWNPSAGLDYGSEAYEWNLGQYIGGETREDGTWTKKFSGDLISMYAEYINALKLTDEEGNELSLKKGGKGSFTKGSYYKYLASSLEDALNRFLADTKFPYGGYKTSEEYIDALNSEEEWITYDAASNTAEIDSMEAFAKYCKAAEKPVGAYDDLDRASAENDLFGTENTESLHFDTTMSYLLQEYSFDYGRLDNWDDAVPPAYSADTGTKDSLGNSVGTRQSMYNAMYYLSPYYEGSGTSDTAKYWRINTSALRADTPVSPEVNLYLALKDADGVEDVQFTQIWGEDEGMVEESGKPVKNFVLWVNACAKKQTEP